VPPSNLERDLQRLEAELKRLEAEYNMFFSGRLQRPPLETRSRVDALVKQYDRAHIQNYADRFRFTSLQARYAAFVDLWDRGLRAREEGRPGPFAHMSAGESSAAGRAEDRILHVVAFRDPVNEPDKLQDLYDALADARRALGEAPVPFHKFTELVRQQVRTLQANGAPEVAFRVAVKDGKVTFTARGLKGAQEIDG
jgi:hypothetical protein